MENRPPLEISTITPESPESSTSIKIEKDNQIFLLIIEYDKSNIILKITEENNLPNLLYSKTMTLSYIKAIHKLFSGINTTQDFIDFINAAYEYKKLSIEIKEDKLIINIISEYLFKQENVEIILLPQQLKVNDIIKNLSHELSLLKEKIKNIEEKFDKGNHNSNLENKIQEIIDKQNIEINLLKEEIKNIKEENESLKEKNKELSNKIEKIILKNEIIDINSTILNDEEFSFIFSAIKERCKKRIIKINKLYQATKDGGDPSIFHKKCDNHPNTLTLIKSAGNRRFGGFTQEIWNQTKEKWKNDENAFIFSLDKRKVYPYKKDGRAIFCRETYGPCFGFGFDIGIDGDPIKGKNLKTYKSSSSYEYGSDSVLSEDTNYSGINAIDYEVFEIKF